MKCSWLRFCSPSSPLFICHHARCCSRSFTAVERSSTTEATGGGPVIPRSLAFCAASRMSFTFPKACLTFFMPASFLRPFRPRSVAFL